MIDVGILDLGFDLDGCSAAERVALTVDIARAAERHGFRRYWIAEHHVEGVSLAAPEIALALIGAGTTSIRIGSGGVLLQYHSPLKVAEVYLTLAAAFPGRVELGVCRGPGVADEGERLALVSGHQDELAPGVYDAKLAELIDLLDPAATHSTCRPRPRGVAAPPLWVLGSGPSSVEQAVQHRARYGFMCFFPGSEEFGPPRVHRYLEGMADSGAGSPLIAVSMVCGRTDQHAAELHVEMSERGYLASNVVGDARYCAKTLEELANCYGASSVLVAFIAPSPAQQLEQIRMLGEALQR